MKKTIYNMFLKQKDVFDYLDAMYPYLLAFQLFECLSNNILLWLRALGHKFFSNFMNFMQYLLLQPIFAIISIKALKGGVRGIWVSCCIGETITLIVIGLYCYFAVDIEKSCEEVYKATLEKQLEISKFFEKEEEKTNKDVEDEDENKQNSEKEEKKEKTKVE